MWSSISFSVDLVPLAQNHNEFLQYIDAEKCFYQQNVLEKAVYRYEKCWMPLYSKLRASGENMENLFPPMDVVWVWHCHMLSPTSYNKDCKKAFGHAIDHSCFNMSEIERKQAETRDVWESLTGCSFDYTSSNSVGKVEDFANFKSNFSYDLIAASERQKNFAHKVSLARFRETAFLNLCLDRYKKFLYLKQQKKEASLVPDCGIDLIWHTHQLCPVAYVKNTVNLLGYILTHNDTDTDRTPGSKLHTSTEMTKILWKQMFNENYLLADAMHRGENPSSYISSKDSAGESDCSSGDCTGCGFDCNACSAGDCSGAF